PDQGVGPGPLQAARRRHRPRRRNLLRPAGLRPDRDPRRGPPPGRPRAIPPDAPHEGGHQAGHPPHDPQPRRPRRAHRPRQARRREPVEMSQIPVSVLTGFLGAGKTTLLNRILTGRHGWKVAVIENEFGEIGVDNQLVMTTEEDLIVMNNGCVCCTIRGDLIQTLNDLLRRPEKFDAILIETTGVADPSPVIQSFFVDEDLKAKLRLDAVITLVDARHIWQHLEANREAREQIAYGDVVLLNKTDLATPADLDRLEKQVR